MTVVMGESDIFLNAEKVKLADKLLKFRSDWIAISDDKEKAGNQFNKAIYNVNFNLVEEEDMEVNILMKDIKKMGVDELKEARNVNITEKAFKEVVNDTSNYFNTIKV